METPPPKNCCREGQLPGERGRGVLSAAQHRTAGNHLVLLMGAEVQQDVQVLELARRALEDQVSKGGHAQVGAALRQEGTRAQPTAGALAMAPLPCSDLLLSLPEAPAQGCVPLSPNTGLAPATGCSEQGSCLHPDAGTEDICRPPHLILAVLANHLQGTLGDERRLQHNLGEDPAGEGGTGKGYRQATWPPRPAEWQSSGLAGPPAQTARPLVTEPGREQSRVQTLPAR